MKKTVWLWQLVGFSATSFFGTLLHFLYEWLDESVWVAPFSGVNESTWEHMKLLFWPMLIFAIVQSFFFCERDDFWCVKTRGVLLGLLLIPLLFYTYNGVVGQSPNWLNIAIFFVSGAAAYIYETYLFNAEKSLCKSPKIAIAALIAISLMFVIFTFATPELAIFKDPLSSTYGL